MFRYGPPRQSDSVDMTWLKFDFIKTPLPDIYVYIIIPFGRFLLSLVGWNWLSLDKVGQLPDYPFSASTGYQWPLSWLCEMRMFWFSLWVIGLNKHNIFSGSRRKTHKLKIEAGSFESQWDFHQDIWHSTFLYISFTAISFQPLQHKGWTSTWSPQCL